MKFLTFTDLHEDKVVLQKLINRASKSDIEFVICCGDISNFGRGLKNVLKTFNKIGKKMYVVPGNHEEPDEAFKEAMSNYKNCIDLHMKVVRLGDYLFLGYGGGGFAMEDARFRKVSREWYGKYKNEKIVLVTHMPPFDTKLDKLEMGHVGNKDYRKFIQRIKPKLAISGHLHETVGEMDKIGSTKLIHPGWDGMVIELK
tara:strand:- start:81 stop:680 length:600 start_codon:yes stop_codon:yes gene_type:complete